MVMRGFDAGACMEILNWPFCWPSLNETFPSKDFGRKVRLRIEEKKDGAREGI